MGTLTHLPGAERVVAELRHAIDEALPGLPEDVRRQLGRELDARFSRSALEGRSLADILHGDRHRITVGGREIEISLHSELGEHRAARDFDMTVNSRRLAGSGGSAGRSTSAGGRGEIAGNMRVSWRKVFGFDLPKIVGHLGGSRSKTFSVVTGTSEYRRTETDGPVTELTRGIRHDVRLQVHGGRGKVTDRTWTVEGDDVAARIVIPREHSPQWTVSAEEVAKAGRADRVDALPDDRIDFSGQTSAVYPSIAASRDLALEIARVDAEAAGRPVPADLTEVPAEILDITRPSALEAHFAEVTSEDGWRVRMPDGRRATIRLTFGPPDHVTSGTGVEIEHYRAANSRVRTGTSTNVRIEGQARAGGRFTLSSGETSGKATAQIGVSADAGRRTGSSEYVGASDVIRGTYSSDGITHRYSGSDMYVSVTPDPPAGQRARTVHLRVDHGADFMMPDRIARDHGLDGPSPDRPPIAEQRTYRPDLAVTSAYVERFDGGAVLPEVERILRDRGHLPEGEGPARSLLRAAFGEPALAANIASLRKGVVQWFPVESGFGITKHVGVRVRAVLEDGTHTAERPEVGHMARVQGLSGSDSLHESGSGRGARVLARVTGRDGTANAGAQVGGTRNSQSETGHGEGTGLKDIDRRQTCEGSQEFTHQILRYRIEVVGSGDAPAGLEQGINAVRHGVEAFARLTGNDAAVRFWDSHRPMWSETATAEGSVRLLVPDHLTMPAAEGEHVPGSAPVVGEFPRWAHHTPPTEMNATLQRMVGRISFPGAEVIHDWAQVAALPPERRGPVPSLADRPAGYELSQPRGLELSVSTDPRTLLSQVKALLAHQYDLPALRPGETVTVGLNVTGLHKVTEALLKRREYVQAATTYRDGGGRGTDVSGRGGGSGGPGDLVGLFSGGGGRGSADASEAVTSIIRERNVEVNDQNHVYAASTVLVLHREAAPDLLIDVPDALYIRLTEENVAEFDRLHPGLIRHPDQ
jgi:hypothetical protein